MGNDADALLAQMQMLVGEPDKLKDNLDKEEAEQALQALKKKMETLFEQVMEGGEKVIDDLIVKKAKEVAKKRFKADDDEQSLVGKVVKHRLEKGPIINFGKQLLKKKIIDGDDE